MYVIYIDENTGLTKVMTPTNQGEKLHASFSTIKDFCNALTSNAKVDTPIMPPSCFKYSASNEGIHMYLFYPSREIDFNIRTYGGEGGAYKIRIPNTVIKAQLSAPNNNKSLLVGGHIYFTDAMIPTDDMKLYKPPFPNVYEDCRICYGGVVRPEYNIKNLFGVDAVHSMFFNNTANSDLWRRETIGSKEFNDPVKFLKALSDMETDEQMKVYFQADKFKTVFSALTI